MSEELKWTATVIFSEADRLAIKMQAAAVAVHTVESIGSWARTDIEQEAYETALRFIADNLKGKE